SRRSYGHHRFQILAAFVNGVTLIGVVALIVVEAIHRLLAPVEVLGGTMMVIAGLGLAVNLAAFLILHGGQRTNLNIRGAIFHVVGDLLGSVAAIVAAAVIVVTAWTPIDPLLSLLAAALIVRSAWLLVRESAHILMEGTPVGLDVGQLRSALTVGVPGLRDIHHVHVWSLTPERPLLTLHARVDDDADDAEVMHGIKGFLARHFGIDHTTIQIERGGCADA
ncbi:MAG: zinc transporter ZitB, partial [Acidobacteria bacterium RIFCSPLOWO2_12_FULL_67_14b]